MEDKKCLECEKTIIGRKDKKFCDDSCRNNYNNRLNSDPSNYVRNVNNLLRKNRRILFNVFDSKPDLQSVKVHRDTLIKKGFDFKFHTSVYTTKQDKVYHFCYEYGYMALGNDFYLIVQRQEYKAN